MDRSRCRRPIFAELVEALAKQDSMSVPFKCARRALNVSSRILFGVFRRQPACLNSFSSPSAALREPVTERAAETLPRTARMQRDAAFLQDSGTRLHVSGRAMFAVEKAARRDAILFVGAPPA